MGPLHLACWQNEHKIIQLLIKRGADGGAKDWYANTARDLGEDATRSLTATLLDEKKRNISSATLSKSSKSQEEGAEWKSQNLNAPCSMTVSDVQARMIEFSIRHCQENEIGGEWS